MITAAIIEAGVVNSTKFCSGRGWQVSLWAFVPAERRSLGAVALSALA
jgi:hypothetical protein